MNKRKVLGKGLEALIPSFEYADSENGIQFIDIDNIYPNTLQPRKNFNPDEMNDLANSIKEQGLIQPIVVSPDENGKYEIIVGERRWRACKIAGINKISCILKNYSVSEKIIIALIENIQRENLNPIELANGFNVLLEQFNLTQEKLADQLGKSRSSIANTLRLIKLPKTVQEDVISGKLTEGHARCLLNITDIDIMEKVRNKIQEEKWSVRRLEKAIQLYQNLPDKFLEIIGRPATTDKELINNNIKDEKKNDQTEVIKSEEDNNITKNKDIKEKLNRETSPKDNRVVPPLRKDYSPPEDNYDFIFPEKKEESEYYTQKNQGFGFLKREEANGYISLLEEHYKLPVNIKISSTHKEYDIHEYKGQIIFDFEKVEEFYSLIYALLTRNKRDINEYK